MNPEKNLKEISNRSDHRCFGCSPNNRHGLQMKFYTDDSSVYSWIVVPPHLSGWSDLVHGGVLSTIMDEIMSWTAIHTLRKFILTKSIGVDFLKPVFIGQRLMAEGRVSGTAKKRQATVEGYLYNDDDRLCVKGTGTFALFTLDEVRKMRILGEEALKDFEDLVRAW